MLLAEIQHGGEVWHRVAGAPGYEVSNYGRLRHEGRAKKIWKNGVGKEYAQLWVNGTQISVPLAKLVFDSFESNRPVKVGPKSRKARKADKKRAALLIVRVEGRRDAWALSRQTYRNSTVYIPADGKHSEPGNFKVLRNFAATVIDGWFDEPDSQFKAHHIRAISICRDYWHALDEAAYERKTRRGFIPTKAYLATLRRVQGMACRVPLWQWHIFENVVRWDEPTGIPGSKFSKIRPESIGAAKRIVAEVARCIA